MLGVSIRRDGKIQGHDLLQKEKAIAAGEDTIRTLDDGTVVVNTTALGKDIIGYSGTVPLEISLKDDHVVGVKALDNAETWSCYKGGHVHCGTCGTCVERKEALREAGIEDNTPYQLQ